MLVGLCSFAQKNETDISIYDEEILIRSKRFSKYPYFKKSIQFFVNNESDSTLVYTTKLLSVPNLDREIYNYCYLIRGISFWRKSAFDVAETEFHKIQENFIFFNLANYFLGLIVFDRRDFEKALTIFENLDNLKDEEFQSIQKSKIHHNIGVCHMHLKHFNKSEIYLQKALNYWQIQQDSIELFSIYSDVANLYYEQYHDKEAIVYFEKAYNLSKLLKKRYRKKSIGALNMAVVEENRNKPNQALIYYKEYVKWKDSLNNQNRIYETAQLEKKNAIALKQKEVNQLATENKLKDKQRNTLLVAASILLLVLGVTYYLYREKLKTNSIISAQKTQLNALNTTKDKLFSIVSHDLRSSVNAIKNNNAKLLQTLETEDKQTLSKTIQHNGSIVNEAYVLLDNLLNWALLQTQQKTFFEMGLLNLAVTVNHVAHNYKGILEDKQIRFNNTIAKATQIYTDQESLKIILRNLIDNAIKFSDQHAQITISAEAINNTYLNLVIEDDGIGMNDATINELMTTNTLLSKKQHEDQIGTGLGLHLVKSMVHKNKGSFTIESEPSKGTKITLTFLKTPQNGTTEHTYSRGST